MKSGKVCFICLSDISLLTYRDLFFFHLLEIGMLGLVNNGIFMQLLLYHKT